MDFIFSWQKTIFYSLVLPLENKIHIFAPPCNILYVDLQTDNKGRMTTHLSLECMTKLSFLYYYALIFCHALLLHKHLGKNENKKLDLHLCDLVIALIVVGIIVLTLYKATNHVFL